MTGRRAPQPQHCPRRPVAGPRRDGRDRWVHTRWTRRRLVSGWLRARWARLRDRLGVRGSRFYGGTYWPAGAPRPRTCTYCGGVHPDDAVTLLLAGWELEGAGKADTRRLHPPGYDAGVRAMLAAIRARRNGLPRRPAVRSPVPPVTLYIQHCTTAQIAQLNAAIATSPGRIA